MLSAPGSNITNVRLDNISPGTIMCSLPTGAVQSNLTIGNSKGLMVVPKS